MCFQTIPHLLAIPTSFLPLPLGSLLHSCLAKQSQKQQQRVWRDSKQNDFYAKHSTAFITVFTRAFTKCMLNRKTFTPNSSQRRLVEIICLGLHKGFFLPVPSTS